MGSGFLQSEGGAHTTQPSLEIPRRDISVDAMLQRLHLFHLSRKSASKFVPRGRVYHACYFGSSVVVVYLEPKHNLGSASSMVHSSLVPFPCVLVLRCTYSFVFFCFLPSRHVFVACFCDHGLDFREMS